MRHVCLLLLIPLLKEGGYVFTCVCLSVMAAIVVDMTDSNTAR